jgi:hypothetical protein
MGKNKDDGIEKIGAVRISPITDDLRELNKLRAFQDGQCIEGGCESAPTYKLEEKMGHGWVITDFLCAQHADERSYRLGLGRL